MVQPAFITLDLVRKTALQGFTRVIDTLLCVANAIKQLPSQGAQATVDLSLEINDVRDNQFGGSARGRRTQVCDEIANGKIDFVTDCRDDWHDGMEYRARDDLFVELPQIFDAPSTACDYDEIDRRKELVRLAELANGHCNFVRCSGSLHAHRVDQDLQPRRATTEHVEYVADRCSAGRGHDSDSPRKFRQRPFAFRRK